MPPRKQWVFTPDRGGVRIPETVQRRTAERIRRYAEQHFAGRYTRLDIRFRGQFCLVRQIGVANDAEGEVCDPRRADSTVSR